MVTGDALVGRVDADSAAELTGETESLGRVVPPRTLGDAAAQRLHKEVFSFTRQAVLGDGPALAGATRGVT